MNRSPCLTLFIDVNLTRLDIQKQTVNLIIARHPM